MKGNAIVDTVSMIESSIGRRTTGHRRRSPDVPWWLLLIPTALFTIIMLVISLTLLVVSWHSESVDVGDTVEAALPVVDELELTPMASMPAFSR